MHWFKGEGIERIDYIFLSDTHNLIVKDVKIDHYSDPVQYPSDHFPVVVDFKEKRE
ncbi:MAG: hypothetical protein JXA77_15545 [Bacteroidales bacterium]|nr:hypothetical protein [Bacteroidales bacterium]MBN2821363.1 hypothetical protein [Bacteroidales bacterium]